MKRSRYSLACNTTANHEPAVKKRCYSALTNIGHYCSDSPNFFNIAVWELIFTHLFGHEIARLLSIGSRGLTKVIHNVAIDVDIPPVHIESLRADVIPAWDVCAAFPRMRSLNAHAVPVLSKDPTKLAYETVTFAGLQSLNCASFVGNSHNQATTRLLDLMPLTSSLTSLTATCKASLFESLLCKLPKPLLHLRIPDMNYNDTQLDMVKYLPMLPSQLLTFEVPSPLLRFQSCVDVNGHPIKVTTANDNGPVPLAFPPNLQSLDVHACPVSLLPTSLTRLKLTTALLTATQDQHRDNVMIKLSDLPPNLVDVEYHGHRAYILVDRPLGPMRSLSWSFLPFNDGDSADIPHLVATICQLQKCNLQCATAILPAIQRSDQVTVLRTLMKNAHRYSCTGASYIYSQAEAYRVHLSSDDAEYAAARAAERGWLLEDGHFPDDDGETVGQGHLQLPLVLDDAKTLLKRHGHNIERMEITSKHVADRRIMELITNRATSLVSLKIAPMEVHTHMFNHPFMSRLTSLKIVLHAKSDGVFEESFVMFGRMSSLTNLDADVVLYRQCGTNVARTITVGMSLSNTLKFVDICLSYQGNTMDVTYMSFTNGDLRRLPKTLILFNLQTTNHFELRRGDSSSNCFEQQGGVTTDADAMAKIAHLPNLRRLRIQTRKVDKVGTEATRSIFSDKFGRPRIILQRGG